MLNSRFTSKNKIKIQQIFCSTRSKSSNLVILIFKGWLSPSKLIRNNFCFSFISSFIAIFVCFKIGFLWKLICVRSKSKIALKFLQKSNWLSLTLIFYGHLLKTIRPERHNTWETYWGLLNTITSLPHRKSLAYMWFYPTLIIIVHILE